MKTFYKSTILLLLATVLVISCDGIEDSLVNDRIDALPDPPTPPAYTTGSADMSKYVAIGNSLTAGYADGALYDLSQNYSFPALMAGMFEQAGASATFNQPFINSTNGYNTSVNGAFAPGACASNPLGRFKLDTSIPGPSPTITGDCPTNYSGPALNNFGVPGIQLGQLLTGATGGPADPGNPAYNPFYARFASDPGNSTILGDALAAAPTFFTLWIGNNDVLGYAVSGASNEAIFTSEGDFQTYYEAVITNLMNNSTANGVVANIPPVTTIPYFRAIPWNVVDLTAQEASDLNDGFASVNGAIQACVNLGYDSADLARRVVSYSEGEGNPILAIDEELADLGPCFDALLGANQITPTQRAQLAPYEQSRPLTEGELVLLSAGSVLGTEADGDDTSASASTPIGVVIPLGFNISNGNLDGDRYYLTLAEQQAIQQRTNAFNVTIATEVAQANANAGSTRIGLLDVNSGFPGNPNTDIGLFADLLGLDGELGIRVDGVLLQPDFSPNGIFSTDGIHPNPRGAAIMANEFNRVIEETFGATLPDVDVLNLPGVVVCNGDCVSEQ